MAVNFVLVQDLVEAANGQPRVHTLRHEITGGLQDFSFPSGKAIPVPCEYAHRLRDFPDFRVSPIEESAEPDVAEVAEAEEPEPEPAPRPRSRKLT